MKDQEEGVKKKSRLRELAPAVISCIAVLVSLLSLVSQSRTRSDSITTNLISSTYNDLGSQYPLQGHLFCLPGEYDTIRAQVRQATIKRISDESERAQLLLEERAIAERVFTLYEEYFVLWEHATKFKDSSRADFLKKLLDYFSGRVLTNPRLQWYWSSSGGGLEEHFTAEAIEYYKRNVKTNPGKEDPSGPFAAINPSAQSQ